MHKQDCEKAKAEIEKEYQSNLKAIEEKLIKDKQKINNEYHTEISLLK